MKILQFCAFVIASAPFSSSAELHPLSDEFIDSINKKFSTWRAGRNFAKDIELSYIKNLMGVHPDHKNALPPVKTHNLTGLRLPEEFDSRQQWPKCQTIQDIRDQGHCGSCWAFGAVECMSDRICIHSNGTVNVRISADDLLSCCVNCGGGCQVGGIPALGWKYWVSEGIVSGGDYGSHQGCRPYEIPPMPSFISSRVSHDITPTCKKMCEEGYNVPYAKDKHFGKTTYSLSSDVEQLQTEIMTNGPVEAAFEVYEDFVHYKKGVYQHVTGNLIAGHAVKVMGWGVEDGVPYWLMANSWGVTWGELHGTFKIIRGKNHLGIEDAVVAGLPR